MLMDVQMPEMSGFEATQAIRARESADGQAPAHRRADGARDAGRPRALSRGRDGWLPVQADRRRRARRHHRALRRRRRTPGVGVRAAPAATSAIFDEQAALAHTGDDRRLLKRIISLFRSDQASALRRIERAIAQRDGEALRLAAHALKGSSATVGAAAGRDAAAELEQIGRCERVRRRRPRPGPAARTNRAP